MSRDLIVNGELVLHGPVGGDWWDDSGFTTTDVLQALAELDGDVTVRLNSGGGVAWDGVAINNALKARADLVTIVVDGVAASAASIIAMAGDEIIMPTGALMMIHNASSLAYGTADDLEKSITLLRKLDGQMAAIYAERTGLDLADVRALMDAETWLTGPEAVDQGFATGTGAEGDKAAKASTFDYRIYAHAPKPLIAQARKLKAPAAESHGWGVPMARAAIPRTPSAAPAAQPEVTMTQQTPAAPQAAAPSTPAPAADASAIAQAVAEDRARRKAVLALPEASGREALAEHLIEATAMSVADIGAALAAAPAAQAAAPAPQETPEAHAARRAAAGGLAVPGGANAPPAPARASWGKVTDRLNGRRA